MINIDQATIAAIKTYLADKSLKSGVRVMLKTSGCCEPALSLIFDQARPDDLVADKDGLTIVMDPDTHRITGDVSIELADPGACPSFRIIPDRPLSEWSGFSVTSISTE
jgi:Fe-S cluster assembly iron-binding protein IscA